MLSLTSFSSFSYLNTTLTLHHFTHTKTHFRPPPFPFFHPRRKLTSLRRKPNFESILPPLHQPHPPPPQLNIHSLSSHTHTHHTLHLPYPTLLLLYFYLTHPNNPSTLIPYPTTNQPTTLQLPYMHAYLCSYTYSPSYSSHTHHTHPPLLSPTTTHPTYYYPYTYPHPPLTPTFQPSLSLILTHTPSSTLSLTHSHSPTHSYTHTYIHPYTPTLPSYLLLLPYLFPNTYTPLPTSHPQLIPNFCLQRSTLFCTHVLMPCSLSSPSSSLRLGSERGGGVSEWIWDLGFLVCGIFF